MINGILFRVRTGVPWRDVPARYGRYQTLYKGFAGWEQDGTWARIEAALQCEADALPVDSAMPASARRWGEPQGR